LQALEDLDPAAVQVMEKIRKLESLVKKLSGQLDLANAAVRASSATGSSPGGASLESSSHDPDQQRHTSPSSNTSNVQQQFGRLVVQDDNRSRYVSSGFWSRVNDEVRLPVKLERFS